MDEVSIESTDEDDVTRKRRSWRDWEDGNSKF